LGREEEAIEKFIDALKIKPDDYESLRNIGISLSNLGQEEEAIGKYTSAIRIKPDDYVSLRNIGISLINLGREEEAIEKFIDALKIKPDDYESLRNIGISLSNLGREEKAVEKYTEALKIKPDDYVSLKNIGISLSKLDRKEEAIEKYIEALKIKPDDYILLRNLVSSLSTLGRENEAIEKYGHMFESEDWRNLISKAFALKNIGFNEEAAKIFSCISKNKSKVRDKEIIGVVNLLNENKNVDEKDILVEIIRDIIKRTTDSKDEKETYNNNKYAFFKTIDDIELRFKKFVDCYRSIPNDFFSFLSVLRRWNSYTPILPSEKDDNKGGGYFLFHAGKGIVIDPGFNFIENFYQEGFKIADIDAVLITHAHNDHTVDLESILTLIHQHNKNIINQNNEENKLKKIDLLMNLGTFKKYSGLLDLRNLYEIYKVTVLMPNATYELPEEYQGIKIYTTKAKHDETIDERYAIGFIIEINEKIRIGFTGDTGWDENMVQPFKDLKPQLVVAHLGSVKRKEFDYLESVTNDDKNSCFYSNHLGLLGLTKFLDETKPQLTIISEFGEELRTKRKKISDSVSSVLDLICLPGDIGLHIRLCDLGVHCLIEEDFVDYKSINVLSRNSDKGCTLYFYADKHEYQRLDDAVSNKIKMKPTPLFKRTKSYSLKS